MRERFFKLRDKLLNTTPKICIERAKIVTEAYKKYDAYPNKRNSSVVGRKNIKRQSYCHAAAGSVG